MHKRRKCVEDIARALPGEDHPKRGVHFESRAPFAAPTETLLSRSAAKVESAVVQPLVQHRVERFRFARFELLEFLGNHVP